MASKIASNSEVGCPTPGCVGFMENVRPEVVYCNIGGLD